MTRSDDQPSPALIPKPIVRKMRWPFPIVWLVPIAALIVTAIYLYQHMKDRGPLIAVHFTEAEGVRIDETPVQFRGVEVGKVAGISLSADQQQAIVHIRLIRGADSFARNGAGFWIVRPQISTDSITGLGTLVSGPYIAATPGNGEAANDFTALAEPPPQLNVGLHVILRADQADKLQRDSF